MLHDILSSRAIQVGIVFFVLVISGSLLYSWHVRDTTEVELERHDQFLQGLGNKNEARLVRGVNLPTENETPGETPKEIGEPQMSDNMDVFPIDKASEFTDVAAAFLPDDRVSEEAAPAAEMPVSPFGFGPYPEVPAGYMARHGQTVWQAPGSLPFYDQQNIELLHRVMIASWNDGDTHFTSATLENGKVYLQYPNTLYVRYAVSERSDGTVARYITSWASGKPNRAAVAQILKGKIPTGVALIDLDSEDAGIDPYTFLELD